MALDYQQAREAILGKRTQTTTNNNYQSARALVFEASQKRQQQQQQQNQQAQQNLTRLTTPVTSYLRQPQPQPISQPFNTLIQTARQTPTRVVGKTARDRLDSSLNTFLDDLTTKQYVAQQQGDQKKAEKLAKRIVEVNEAYKPEASTFNKYVTSWKEANRRFLKTIGPGFVQSTIVSALNKAKELAERYENKQPKKEKIEESIPTSQLLTTLKEQQPIVPTQQYLKEVQKTETTPDSEVFDIINEPIKKWVSETSPTNPKFLDAVGNGVGSMAGFMTLSTLTGAGPASMAIWESMSESAEVYTQNRESGLSVEESSVKADKTLVLNIILNTITNKLGLFSEGENKLRKFVMSSTTESIQEGTQQIISNANTGKEGLDLLEGVGESMGVGAIIGGPTSLILPSDISTVETTGEVMGGTQEQPAEPDKLEQTYDTPKQIEKEVIAYRGAKDETIDVTKQNGITGGESMTLDPMVANRFADRVGGEVRAYRISPDAVVIDHSQLEKLNREDIRQFLEDNNVDVVRFDVPEGVQGESELRIINDRVITELAKEQLAEIQTQKLQGEQEEPKPIKEPKAEENVQGGLGDTIRNYGEGVKYDGGHALDNLPKNTKTATVNRSVFGTEIKYDPRELGKQTTGKLRSNYWLEKINNGERPPVLVGVKNGELKVVDGNHRLTSYIEAGVDNIPTIFTKEATSLSPSKGGVSNATLYRGSNGKVTKVTKSFNRVLEVENSQRQLMSELAEDGDTRAQEILKDKDFFVKADNYLRELYSDTYDAIQYNNADRPQVGTEYHDLSDGRFYAEKEATAKAYSLKGRDAKYKPVKETKEAVIEREKAINDYINNKDTVKFRTAPELEIKEERVTTKFLEDPLVSTRKTASYQYLYELTKSTKLGLKQNEAQAIRQVLDKYYKDKKQIDMAEFRRVVIGQMMPLDTIKTDTYATYGSDAIGLYEADMSTYILNSPYEHGETGHFSGDFEETVPAKDVEIREIPAQQGNPQAKWAVVKKDVELNEQNIEQNVLTVATSKKAAQQWIKNHTIDARIDSATQETEKTLEIKRQRGLFSHFRTFDITEGDQKTAHIVEVQSDAFQKGAGILGEIQQLESSNRDYRRQLAEYPEAIKVRKERIERYKRVIKAVKDGKIIKELEKVDNLYKVDKDLADKYQIRENDVYEINREKEEAVGLYEDNIRDTEEQIQKAKELKPEIEKTLAEQEKRVQDIKSGKVKPIEAQFVGYKNIWHERSIREAISIKAREGFDAIRFPTPRTVAVIEGFAGGDGYDAMPYEVVEADDPERLQPGDIISYSDNNMTVVSADQSRIQVAENVHSFLDSEAREEQAGSIWEDVVYELEKMEELWGKIDTPEKADFILSSEGVIKRHYNVEKGNQLESKPTKEELKGIPDKVLEDALGRSYAYSIDWEVKDLLNKMSKSSDETVSYEDFEEDWKYDYLIDYEMDYEDIYNEVYYEPEGNDTRIWVVTEGSSEQFMQPDEYDDVADVDSFNIEDFDGAQRTVLEFYDKQVNRYVKKFRTGNIKEVTDENGYTWLETKVTKDDIKPPTAYRLKENLASVGIKITDEQEQEIIRLNKEIFGDTSVKITGQILANNKALGSYSERVIKILDGQADPKDTFYHEAVHKYLDIFTTREEYIKILKEAQEVYQIEDLAQVEEKLAEDFIRYAKSREGLSGKMRVIIDKILYRLRQYFDNSAVIDGLYADIISGKAVKKTRKATKPAKKTSKIARSIEQKAIEARLTEGFGELAEFDPITIEEQSRLATKLMSDQEKALAVIRGEEPLPTGLRGASVITAAETVILEKGDMELAYALANSPLVSETSEAAQTLRLTAERQQDSLTRRLKEIRDVRERAYKRRNGKSSAGAVKEEVAKIKKEIKKPSKYDWQTFINSIEC